MKCAVLFCVLAVPLSVAAQDAQSASSDIQKLPVPAWAKAIANSFSKPLHPVIGGIATSGGVGAGIGYDSPQATGWFQTGRAMVTFRRYWAVGGEVGTRGASKRFQIGAFGAVRDMGRLDYFGIGPDTGLGERAAYRLRETTFGARGWHRPLRAIRVGGSIGQYLPDVGSGRTSSVRSIESVLTDGSVPAFGNEPTFGRYRGFVEFMNPVLDEQETLDTQHYRGGYQIAFEALHDQQTGTHNLHRWEAETQQRLPGLRPGQRLTLHGFLASTNRTADVPFYLMYTLGGSGGLKTFRPDMLGGDATRASLRGYRNFRFRDRDLVLMQAEYRIPLHRYVDATVFVDAGKVAQRTPELFTDLRKNTGFSLSYMRKGRTVGRMDVGFGGGEGVHVFWSFGAFQD